MPDWVEGMKKITLNAYMSNQPCDLFFGSVVSEKPVSVIIEDLKLTLGGGQVMVPDHFSDRTVPVTVGGVTGTAVIPGALKAGDRVALLRKTGGQKYIVIGKVG